ncbi:hypothetical protein D3C78_951690 [compost metagenome]
MTQYIVQLVCQGLGSGGLNVQVIRRGVWAIDCCGGCTGADQAQVDVITGIQTQGVSTGLIIRTADRDRRVTDHLTDLAEHGATTKYQAGQHQRPIPDIGGHPHSPAAHRGAGHSGSGGRRNHRGGSRQVQYVRHG